MALQVPPGELPANGIDSNQKDFKDISNTTGSLPLPGQRSTFDLEPNPFEQSFAVKDDGSSSTQDKPLTAPMSPPQLISTPGGRRHFLPPVASISSPQSLMPNPSTPGTTWANSLRGGPLTPNMLQGPQQPQPSSTLPPGSQPVQSLNNATAVNSNGFVSFSRTGLTPSESGIRTGLTPGGQLTSGMFASPGPATAAILGLTDSSLFANNSMSGVSLEQSSTSVPAPSLNPIPLRINQSVSSSASTDAANGLYLLSRRDDSTITDKGGSQGLSNNSSNNSSLNGGDINNLSEQISGRNEQRQPQQSQQQQSVKRKRQNNKDTTKKISEESKPPRAGNKSKQRSGPPSIDEEVFKTDGSEEEDDFDSSSLHGNGGSKRKLNDEEKRKSFLERNRVAALKCRQRKKQWLASLQAKVEFYSTENESLNSQVSGLRDQVSALKSLLLAHKDCPIALPPDILSATLGSDYQPNSQDSNGRMQVPVMVPVGNPMVRQQSQQQQQQQQQLNGPNGPMAMSAAVTSAQSAPLNQVMAQRAIAPDAQVHIAPLQRDYRGWAM